MAIKTLSFIIRFIAAACIGWLAGYGSQEILRVGTSRSDEIAIIVWVIGVIISIIKFNISFDFLKKFEKTVFNGIDNLKKHEIEKEMIRVKELLDKQILTQNEYNEKIKLLKEKYFSLS